MDTVSQENIESSDMIRRVRDIDLTSQTAILIGTSPSLTVIEEDIIAYLNILRARGAVYENCARSRTYRNSFTRSHGNRCTIDRAFRMFSDAKNKNSVIEYLLGN